MWHSCITQAPVIDTAFIPIINIICPSPYRTPPWLNYSVHTVSTLYAEVMPQDSAMRGKGPYGIEHQRCRIQYLSFCFTTTQYSYAYYLVYGKTTHPRVVTRQDDSVPRPRIYVQDQSPEPDTPGTRFKTDYIGNPPPPRTTPDPTLFLPMSVRSHLPPVCTP